MRQYFRTQIKSKYIYAVVVMLFAYCITFNIFFYSGYGNLNFYATTEPEIKVGNERELEKGDTTYNFFASDADRHSIKSAKTLNIDVSSILAYTVDLLGAGFHIILIMIFFIYCLNLFIFLPDDNTLVNQRVRLNH